MHTFKKLPIQVPSKKTRKDQVNVGKVITSFPRALLSNKILSFSRGSVGFSFFRLTWHGTKFQLILLDQVQIICSYFLKLRYTL